MFSQPSFERALKSGGQKRFQLLLRRQVDMSNKELTLYQKRIQHQVGMFHHHNETPDPNATPLGMTLPAPLQEFGQPSQVAPLLTPPGIL